MHAHRIEVFDRADDDDVVLRVAHHLELELFPTRDAFLNQDLAVERELETARGDLLELLQVVGDAATRATEREARADHAGQADLVQRLSRFCHVVGKAAVGAFEPDLLHRGAELLAALGLLNRVRLGADQLDAQLLEHAHVVQLHRTVEGCLAAEGRQDCVWPLLLQDLGDDFRREGLDVGPVRSLRIGHDRRRIAVDEDDPVAIAAERLAGLHA